MAMLGQLVESLCDCVINAGGGMVGKIADWLFSKTPDRVHQADVALLNQVQHRNARGGVLFCNAHDLSKVSFNYSSRDMLPCVIPIAGSCQFSEELHLLILG